MPFLDRLELAAVSGAADRTAYRAVADLERLGLVSSFPHATDLLRTTRRFHLTTAGLHALAEAENITPDVIIRSRPVSAQWRRVLMERLDAVAVIYRLASFIAAQELPVRFRWYRAAPLDAAMELPGRRIIGFLRQGPTSDRTGFSKRLWRLRQEPLPGAILLLMPDEVRLRHARGLPTTRSLPSLLALERDAVWSGPSDPVWLLPSVAAPLDLRQMIGYVNSGGSMSTEAERRRATQPRDISLDDIRRKIPHWMLPALLKPAEKRLLDLLFDWPGISAEDLRGIMGVSRTRLAGLLASLTHLGMVQRVYRSGRRLALADRGLAVPARRDRTSVGVARKRWSVSPLSENCPLRWRNVSGRRSRQLLRHVKHTSAVHGFMASLAGQARSIGWELSQLDPPFRASRYFRHGVLSAQAGGLRSIHPDAFGVLCRGDRKWPFFLEWERRAVRPATMAARLAPYLRYYSSRRPTDAHDARPVLLVVFHGELAPTHFLRVAGEEMQRTGIEVPLWVSHRSLVDDLGPLGRVWRKTGLWEAVHVLPGS